jgi:hypothetical protein
MTTALGTHRYTDVMHNTVVKVCEPEKVTPVHSSAVKNTDFQAYAEHEQIPLLAPL